MSRAPTCAGGNFQAEIRNHFAGLISPRAERALRLHLADCSSCREVYEKHLVLAEIDPVALSAEERIGRGLGVRPRPAAVGWPLLAGAVACAAAVAVFVPLTAADRASGVSDDREFAPRGSARLADEFVVYRIGAGAAPERAPRRMGRGDELAFAYTNPSGFAYLSVFGVDHHGNVRWYHPEWTDAAASPHAIPIAKGPELRELPEAVAHDLEGPTLRLYAVFANEPLGVREIEGSLASDEPGRSELVLPGVLVREWLIEVE
jgi:hypothetical protein